MNKYSRRKDKNHNEVVRALEQIRCKVVDLYACGSIVPGIPDLVVEYRGLWVFVEIKTASGKLTADETAFTDRFKAPIVIARTPKEACEKVVEERRKWKQY